MTEPWASVDDVATVPRIDGVEYLKRASLRKVAAILDDDRNTRPYLKSLRYAAESSTVGTREQRDAILEDW